MSTCLKAYLVFCTITAILALLVASKLWQTTDRCLVLPGPDSAYTFTVTSSYGPEFQEPIMPVPLPYIEDITITE